MCYQPLPTPQLCQSLSILNGLRKKSLLGSTPHGGEAGHSLAVLSLAPVEQSEANGVCLGTKLWCSGERCGMDQLQLFFSLGSVYLSSDFSAPTVGWNFSTELPDAHKGISVGGCQTHCSGKDDSRKLLFCHIVICILKSSPPLLLWRANYSRTRGRTARPVER